MSEPSFPHQQDPQGGYPPVSGPGPLAQGGDTPAQTYAWPTRGPGSFQPPFAPAGVSFRPVCTRLRTARLLTAGISWGIAVVGLVILGALTSWPVIVLVALAVIAVLAAWTFWLIPRQVRAWGYAERDEDLLVRRGVMFKRMIVVPYGRMQFVDVKMGPIERMVNLASVKLHTAAVNSDAVIPGLDPQEAEMLRDTLAARGEARLAGL